MTVIPDFDRLFDYGDRLTFSPGLQWVASLLVDRVKHRSLILRLRYLQISTLRLTYPTSQLGEKVEYTLCGVVLTKLRSRSWQADPYTSVSFQVPDNWKAGRVWVSYPIGILISTCTQTQSRVEESVNLAKPNLVLIRARREGAMEAFSVTRVLARCAFFLICLDCFV